MGRIFALLMAAGACGCSAGLVRAGSAWGGTPVPLGADDFDFEVEEGGVAGRFAARLGLSIYTSASDDPLTPFVNEAVAPRLTLGFSYIWTLPNGGDVEAGLDLVPDIVDWFGNAYLNLRGDYVHWLGESGFAVTGGLGLFIEGNYVYTDKGGEGVEGKVGLHIDLGALYLIPESAFDVRLAYQIPLASGLNVAGVLLMSANYAF